MATIGNAQRFNSYNEAYFAAGRRSSDAPDSFTIVPIRQIGTIGMNMNAKIDPQPVKHMVKFGPGNYL